MMVEIDIQLIYLIEYEDANEELVNTTNETRT
jgi:hypothetical protein